MNQISTIKTRCKSLIASLFLISSVGLPSLHAQTEADLRARIADLERQLASARSELTSARQQQQAAPADTSGLVDPATVNDPGPKKIELGPLTIGGAIRANFVMGDYGDSTGGPSRSDGDAGTVELDTFRINVDLSLGNMIGALEYRWYNSYNFLHTGWLGYDLGDNGTFKAGVTRVPFGPGAYGVSNSWFFDQHYYVGLSDDMDTGIVYSASFGNLSLDLAYFLASEGTFHGNSLDSARYSYDFVKLNSGLGYEEEHQFNLRAIYAVDGIGDLGISLQYGRLNAIGFNDDDADHLAASAHMKNRFGNLTLVSQLTYYEVNITANNPWGTDSLIPMGAYDFAWPVATKALIPAVSLQYSIDTPRIPWLDNVTPYIEYSSIIKDEDSFNDSELFVVGAAWWRGGWFIYTDLAFSNGNYFVGSEGDDYSSFAGVGDFGINGNDSWNYRLNINLGYYF